MNEKNYEALVEIIAEEGIAGTALGLAEFIEKEVELSEEDTQSVWARKMLDAAKALRRTAGSIPLGGPR